MTRTYLIRIEAVFGSKKDYRNEFISKTGNDYVVSNMTQLVVFIVDWSKKMENMAATSAAATSAAEVIATTPEEVSFALFQVLDNDSLREKIVKHAILGSNGVVNKRTACNLRLVHPDWNDSVVRILWEAKRPLYTIRLGQYYDDVQGAMEAFSSGGTATPPLRFVSVGDVRSPQDLEDFSNLLTTCGSALVQLRINENQYGSPPLKRLLPDWTLPRLDKLEVIVPWEVAYYHFFESEQIGAVGPDKVTSKLVKFILNAASSLTQLELAGRSLPLSEGDPPLPILDSATLPPNLAKLTMRGDMLRKDIKILTVSPPPPKLSCLTLGVVKVLFENRLFFRILDNLRFTLKSLSVDEGERIDGTSSNSSRIKFPVMERLEELSITSKYVELEDEGGTAHSLVNCFPKLRTLRLRLQTEAMLKKWTTAAQRSQFTGLTSLELLLARQSEVKFLVSVNAGAIQMVNFAFPNLRKLELGVSKEDTRGLEYVFRELRQLTELKIRVCCFKSEKSTNIWDSILTGVLQGHPNSLAGKGSGVSIKNLQELTSFSLDDSQYSSDYRDQLAIPKPYFSDFTFTQALLKMPKLRHVDAPFQASDAVKKQWRNEGRAFH